jgi:hypothetical protein
MDQDGLNHSLGREKRPLCRGQTIDEGGHRCLPSLKLLLKLSVAFPPVRDLLL